MLPSPRLLTRLAAVALTALGVTACGASASSPQTTTHATTAPRRRTRPRRTPQRRPTHEPPRIGKAELVHTAGTTLAVTVARVLDPLAGSGAPLQPGTRAVGVLVEIENRGPGIYDSSATGDISVEPASGPATPVFAARGICQTQLRDFDNYISAGEVRRGCVAFAVTAGAKVLAVHFSPHGQAAGRASWSVAG